MPVVPGQPFQLPLKITDDYKHDLVGLTVLSAPNATFNRSKYFSGGMASLSGPENSSIELKLETMGDRIWQVNLIAKLMHCPPVLPETANTVCKCSSEYLGAIICHPDTLKVEMKDQNWIGKLNESGDYLLGLCPPAFCNTSFVSLPSTLDNVTILSK